MNIPIPGKTEELFNKIAPSYDFLNDLFSFGLHRIWKSNLLKHLKPLSGEKWADLCCGTGDLTMSLASYVGSKGSVLGIDLSANQLAVAQRRAIRKRKVSVSLLNQDVLDNNLPQNSFDGVVMAYGLRNLDDPKKGIEEIYRLLKPGGKAGILDFNVCKKNSINLWFQKFYLRRLVVPIASIFKLRKEYEYIESSLKNFPSGNFQKQIAIDLGFKRASFKLLARGQMGILFLEKE